MLRLALLSCFVLCWPVQDTRPAANKGNASKLDRLGWLAGSWASTGKRQASEEHWTRPAGKMLLGLHRDVRPGKKAFFEYLRIEEDDDGQLRRSDWLLKRSRLTTR